MRSYFYRLIGDQISRVARYSDRLVQVDPLEHDDNVLAGTITCPEFVLGSAESLKGEARGSRSVFLLNGNLNYNLDCQSLLARVAEKLNRHSRLAIVAYNPYLRLGYRLANWLRIRRGPYPTCFFTKTDVRTLAKLSSLEMLQIKAVCFFPFRLLGLGTFINRFLAEIPILRNLSFASVIWFRPSIVRKEKSSLSIIVPARNEAGNIDRLFRELPPLDVEDLEIVFVEGNSEDETWAEIQEASQRYADQYNIQTLRQPGVGKFDAVKHGFAHARMELLTIVDADLTMPPAMLGRFVDAYNAGHGDFINGNRLVYPMEDAAMQRLNLLGNKFFAKTIAYLLNLTIGDSLCGTKLLHSKDYQRQCEWRDDFGDFDPFGDFELLYCASELKLGVVDVPVRYLARTYGSTQIRRFSHGLQLAKMCVIGLFRIKFR